MIFPAKFWENPSMKQNRKKKVSFDRMACQGKFFFTTIIKDSEPQNELSSTQSKAQGGRPPKRRPSVPDFKGPDKSAQQRDSRGRDELS